METTGTIALGIVWGIVFLAMIIVFGKGQIAGMLNMVDRRQMIGDEHTYQRLNAMMEAGEVSLSSYEFMKDKDYRISVEYNATGGASVTNRFSGKNVNKIIEEAYQWSEEEGYINIIKEAK